MMRAVIKLVEPDKMLATVTMTMTVAEWRALKNQLPEAWPGWAFGSILGDVIARATAAFDAETESKP